MAESPKTITLTILEREFRINCPPGAEEKLREAARYLDEKMTEIRNASNASGKVLGIERIAVIAALNITHQLREVESRHSVSNQDMLRLHQLLDEALEQDLQLEL